MAMPQLSQPAQDEIAHIAETVLGVPTLVRRHRDRWDFHELHVWSIKAALEAAYLAGMVDHQRRGQSIPAAGAPAAPGFTARGTDRDATNAQQLMDYLRGYVRRHPANLQQLRQYRRWPEMARAALDRRASGLLDVLPDGVLQAIAEGELDVNALAQHLST